MTAFLPRLGLSYPLAVLLTLSMVAGCSSGSEGPDAGANSSSFTVGGSLLGLETGQRLGLALNGSETIELTDNGDFTFTIPLATGDDYLVAVSELPSDVACAIENEGGLIAANVTNVKVTCGLSSARLSDLSISGFTELSPIFDASTLQYNVAVSVLAQQARFTPTAIDPNALIEVQGAIVASGTASQPVDLSLGDNIIAIRVTSPDDVVEDYQIVVNRGQELLEQVSYIKSSNAEAADQFGFSMALSGDTLVVAAAREESAATGIDGDQSDNSATVAGAVYVFRQQAKTWVQEAYIKASNTETFDNFGFAVALSGDNLAVTAKQEASGSTGINGDQSDNSVSGSGAVYVFHRVGTSWTQEAYIKASVNSDNIGFGESLALSGDTLAVGTPRDDAPSNNPTSTSFPNSGAVYVYQRIGDTWTQQAVLKAINTGSSDLFGGAVSLSGDVLAVGAVGEDEAVTGINAGGFGNGAQDSGAAYIFRRSGSTWAHEAFIKSSNSEAGDSFGAAIAVAGDTLVVGATNEDSTATGVDGDQASNGALSSGAAYVFRFGAGGWAQEAYIKASNTGIDDVFGRSVSLAKDTMVVGTNRESSSAQGINGNQLNDAVNSSGAAYVFRRNGAAWTQNAYIKASNSEINDQFGFAVALSDDLMVVSGIREDSDATGIDGDQNNDNALLSGAAYAFQ